MALLYQAELRPSKIELIAGWAPTQPWFTDVTGASLTSVGSFRFDDPDGEVGIETILVRARDGPVVQVPLTYRGAPLVGGEAWLIGTMQHSVLGQRWVYDATGDPVYLKAVAMAAVTGGTQAEQYLEIDGVRVLRESTALVVGSGKPVTPAPALSVSGTVSTRHDRDVTVVEVGALRLVVVRVLALRGTPGHDSNGLAASGGGVTTEVLTGTWPNQPIPQILVQVELLSR